MNVYFDKNYSGKVYSGSVTYYYDSAIDAFKGVSVSLDNSLAGGTVTLTGYWTKSSRGNFMFQTTTGEWINLYSDGWQLVRMDSYPQNQAQDYVNRMIENNKKIVSCNLFCARYASKLTASEKQLLYQLQTRLENRNLRLINDGLVSSVTTSTPAGYSQLQPYLQSFMQTGGVGVVISGTAVIVITAIVIASLSTAAYFAYKYLFEESADDVKYSEQLTKTLLAKLTPEEYEQLLRETQGIVTKTKIKQMIAGSGNLLKWALIGTAAYMIYDKYIAKGSRL
ncbi:MAG: hypothetical protein KBS70_03335 [Bacteroidales bacterium]|nr:hypothetical protein [Candidatus Colicola equi]